MDLLEKASIILTPTAYNNGEALCVKPSDGSGDFDFSRNSAATRVNAQGLVENVQILSSNLVQNGDFSDGTTGWSNPTYSGNNSASLSIDNGALKIEKNADLDWRSSFVSQTPITYVSGKTYKITYSLKDGTTSGADVYVRTNFDRSANTVNVKALTNDWVEYTDYYVADTSADDISFGVLAWQNTGSGQYYFIDNVSIIEITDDTNLPRINYEGFSYDGSGNVVPDSGCGSWLFEPQSTNLITQSELFSDAYWTKTLMNATDNSTISPSGNVNASLIQEEIYTNSIPNIKNSGSITGLNGNNTLSFYVKNNSGRYLGVSFGSSVERIRTNFDFDTETFKTPIFNGTTTGSVSFDKLGDYYRILITANFPISINSEIFITPLATDTYPFYAFQNSDNRSFYLWGAQVEQQSYATSYIPTNGEANGVTRNQDVCTNGGSLASINSTEGVLYAEIAALANDSTDKALSINNGGFTDRIWLGYSTAASRIYAIGYTNNVLQFVMFKNLPTDTDMIKVAVKYKENDFALWVNGIEEATDTSGLTPIGLNSVDFSINGFGTQNFFGKTKALAVWKEALSDAELTELTTI